MAWLSEIPGGVAIAVRVCPRAAKNAVQGMQGDAVKIRLTAPPVDGAANAALLAFLADALDVAKSRVRLISGQTSRDKRVAVEGVTPQAARERLGLP